jgi:hypothetical protein
MTDFQARPDETAAGCISKRRKEPGHCKQRALHALEPSRALHPPSPNPRKTRLTCFMPGSSTGMWYRGVPPPIMGVGVDMSLRAGV